MDNASNCNKLAELLPDYIPTFQGMDARLRCLTHILNLIAKVITKNFIEQLANYFYLDLHFFLFQKTKSKEICHSSGRQSYQ